MTEMEQQALDEVRALLAPLTVYTVEKILGMGSAGYVLKVRHRVFGLRALKLVHVGLLRSRIIRTRFDTEARIMHSLNHPNVVKVHDLGELPDGSPYIVMDLLEGGTLEDHLNAYGVMPPKQAVRVAIAILRGLQAAHGVGVVHRDIKPQNVLFDSNGTPKITDFGIARVEEGTRSMTREGATMGTFAYMAPEQLSGEHSLVDARSDVHAVGVTLYVMLTCGNLGQEAFFRQIEDHPERLDGVSDALQRVILTATAKERDNRFPTTEAMADELANCLNDLPKDPEATPALGSAPSMEYVDANLLLDAPDPQIVRVGATLTPTPTQAREGHEARQSWPFTGSILQSEVNPVHTSEEDWDGEAPELTAIRQAAKRRFMWRVVAPITTVLLGLLISAGVWFATRPAPVDVKSAISVEPAKPAEPTDTPSALAVTSTVENPTPTRVPTAVVKPNPTPKVVEPPPEATIRIEERGQVRLILKTDTTAKVTLIGDGGTFTITGGSRDIPLGTYAVSVDMPGREVPQIGTLTVTPGLTILTCDDRFKMCTGLY